MDLGTSTLSNLMRSITIQGLVADHTRPAEAADHRTDAHLAEDTPAVHHTVAPAVAGSPAAHRTADLAVEEQAIHTDCTHPADVAAVRMAHLGEAHHHTGAVAPATHNVARQPAAERFHHHNNLALGRQVGTGSVAVRRGSRLSMLLSMSTLTVSVAATLLVLVVAAVAAAQ